MLVRCVLMVIVEFDEELLGIWVGVIGFISVL